MSVIHSYMIGNKVDKIDVKRIFVYYLFIDIIDVIDNVMCCLFFYCNRNNIVGPNEMRIIRIIRTQCV